MQLYIVTIVLILAIAYGGYRIHHALTSKGCEDAGCNGCALKEQCTKRQDKG